MAKSNKLKVLVDTTEVKTLKFWQAVGAEFLGTLILMFVQAILPLGLGNADQSGNVVRVAVGMAFVIVCMASSLGPISGAHLNPAVTFSMMAVCKISIIKGVMYVIAQCLAAIVGAGIAFGITPKQLVESLSATLINPVLDGVYAGFVVEVMLGFILVLTIFGNTDERNGSNPIAPIAIGFAVGLDIMAAALYTGASINPARSLGPAVVLGGDKWANHWVYWIGPTAGGILAAVVYTFALTITSDSSEQQVTPATDISMADVNSMQERLKKLEQVVKSTQQTEVISALIASKTA